MTDIAEEVAPLEDLLYSAGNRVKIANVLLNQKQWDLLPTVLEDLFYGCQMIIDHHCVKEEK